MAKSPNPQTRGCFNNIFCHYIILMSAASEASRTALTLYIIVSCTSICPIDLFLTFCYSMLSQLRIGFSGAYKLARTHAQDVAKFSGANQMAQTVVWTLQPH